MYYTSHAARLRGAIESGREERAVPEAVISVICVEESQPHCSTTDSDGVFFFWDLKVGRKYSLKIEADGISTSVHELHLDGEYTDLGKIAVQEVETS